MSEHIHLFVKLIQHLHQILYLQLHVWRTVSNDMIMERPVENSRAKWRLMFHVMSGPLDCGVQIVFVSGRVSVQ